MNNFTSHANAYRSLILQALAGALALVAPAQAWGVDTEPLNNSRLTANGLPGLLPGTAVSNLAGLGGAGGDVDFFQAPLAEGEVLFGMVTPVARLPSGFGQPDTIVSLFDDSEARTFDDNEDAALFRFEAPATADYRIGVSGCCDFAYDGDASGFSHSESGGYVLTVGRVNPAVPGGGFTDVEPGNQTAASADLIPLPQGTARAAVAQLGDGDVDFFRLDFKAGAVLSAMTAPLDDLGVSFDHPDTLVGLFDSSGANLLVANDDAGGYTSITVGDLNTGQFDVSPDVASDSPYEFGGLGSALRALIPADGTYYLAVTGAFDDAFIGAHSEIGAYALLVGLAVPEPSGAMLAAIAILPGGLRRFVKRNRSAQRGRMSADGSSR